MVGSGAFAGRTPFPHRIGGFELFDPGGLAQVKARDTLAERAAQVRGNRTNLVRDFGDILRRGAVSSVNRGHVTQARFGDIGHIRGNKVHRDSAHHWRELSTDDHAPPVGKRARYSIGVTGGDDRNA